MREFAVLGNPVAKGRPKCECSRGYPHIYTPDKTAAAEEAILREYQNTYPGADPLGGDLWIAVWFFVKGRGDFDNFAKTVTDALNGHAFHDDGQIVEAHIGIIRGKHQFTHIRIGTLDEPLTDFPHETIVEAVGKAGHG